jgi:Rrf2 family protein
LIFHQLKVAGFVVTERGRRGGYKLAMPPEDISVAAIVQALEGPIAPVGCLLSPGQNPDSHCPNKEHCLSRPAWARLQSEIESTLGSITIASLAGLAVTAATGTTELGEQLRDVH